MSKIIILFYILLNSLVLSKPSINQIFMEALNNINISNETYNDIEFINEDVLHGYEVTYKYESNNGLIDENGKVIRTEKDEITYITVSVKINGEVRRLNYKTIVKKLPKVNLHTDIKNFYFDDAVELLLDDEFDRNEYKFIISDESCAELDEDYILTFLKREPFYIYVCDEYDYIVDSMLFDVSLRNPIINIDKKQYVVGETFTVDVENYKISELDIQISNPNIINFVNDEFVIKGSGQVDIIFILKDDERSFTKISVDVYEKTPILECDTNTFTVGLSTKINVINYPNQEDYIILADNDLVEIKNNFIIGKKAGVVNIKVVLKSDESIYSTVTLIITNIMPELIVFQNNIIPNSETYLTIKNIDKLLVNNISDYEFTTNDNDLISISGDKVIAKKCGTAIIKCQSKTNKELTSEATLNIIIPSDKKDINGEIAEGPLYITLEGNKRTYKVGELIKFNVYGLKSYDNYKYTTASGELLNVLDNGTIITKEEGFTSIIVSSKADKEIRGVIYIEIEGKVKVDYARRLIEVAEKELGYKELPNKETKYGIWYGIPDGDWCAMFVTWCAHYSGIGTDVIPFYCGCTAGWKWFKEHNCYGLKGSYTPKAGDIIFFLDDGAGHTGIVTGCRNGTVYTLEGNTSDMVARRSYPLDYHTITGYGIPNYK